MAITSQRGSSMPKKKKPTIPLEEAKPEELEIELERLDAKLDEPDGPMPGLNRPFGKKIPHKNGETVDFRKVGKTDKVLMSTTPYLLDSDDLFAHMKRRREKGR